MSVASDISCEDFFEELYWHQVLGQVLGDHERPRPGEGIVIVRGSPAKLVRESGPIFRMVPGLDRGDGQFERSMVPHHGASAASS